MAVRRQVADKEYKMFKEMQPSTFEHIKGENIFSVAVKDSIYKPDSIIENIR